VARAGTFEFRTAMDLSGYRSGMATAESELKQFAEKSTQEFQRRTADIMRLGTRMTAAVTVPLTAMGAAVLHMSGAFEQSMNKVGALTQATGREFNQLRDLAKELGATTVFSASEAADGMSFLAMAGLETNQIIGAMPATLRLASAAQLDLARAADIVTNIMTGYQIEVENLGGTVDVLTKAFVSANTDLNQLGDAMKFVGPVASGFGIQFEEAAAAVGALSDAGIQGSMAGTTLRGILTRLDEAGKKWGITVRDVNGDMIPFADILAQIEERGVSSAEIMELFGDRAGPGMLALISQGSGAIREFTRELENAGGTAERIADRQLEGFRGSLTRLKSATEGLLIAIGDSGLLGVATSLVDVLTRLVSAAADLPSPVLAVGTAVAAAAAAVGPFLLGLGTLRNLLPVLTTGFNTLNTAMGGLAGPAGVLGIAAIGFSALMKAAGDADKALEPLPGLLDDITRAAAASEDPLGTMEARFDALAETLSGKARESFVMIRGMLTHIVTEAENAAEALLAIELGTTLSGMVRSQFGVASPLDALRAGGASMYGDAAIRGADLEVIARLQHGDFAGALGVIDGIVDLLESGGPATSNVLSVLLEYRDAVQHAYELVQGTRTPRSTGTPAPTPPPGAPGTGGTPGTPEPVQTAVERAVADVDARVAEIIELVTVGLMTPAEALNELIPLGQDFAEFRRWMIEIGEYGSADHLAAITGDEIVAAAIAWIFRQPGAVSLAPDVAAEFLSPWEEAVQRVMQETFAQDREDARQARGARYTKERAEKDREDARAYAAYVAEMYDPDRVAQMMAAEVLGPSDGMRAGAASGRNRWLIQEAWRRSTTQDLVISPSVDDFVMRALPSPTVSASVGRSVPLGTDHIGGGFDLSGTLAGLDEDIRIAGEEFRYAVTQGERDAAQERLESLQKQRDEMTGAARLSGQEFASYVQSAGESLLGLFESIQSGSASGIISGVGGFASSLFGAIGGSLAAAVPWIGVGTSLLGGIAGLIQGNQGRQAEAERERQRAAGAQARGVSSFSINVVINSALQVESLTDQASRSAIRSYEEGLAERMLGAIERSLIPRIQNLESAVGV